jgi:hypothetical protein
LDDDAESSAALLVSAPFGQAQFVDVSSLHDRSAA